MTSHLGGSERTYLSDARKTTICDNDHRRREVRSRPRRSTKSAEAETHYWGAWAGPVTNETSRGRRFLLLVVIAASRRRSRRRSLPLPRGGIRRSSLRSLSLCGGPPPLGLFCVSWCWFKNQPNSLSAFQQYISSNKHTRPCLCPVEWVLGHPAQGKQPCAARAVGGVGRRVWLQRLVCPARGVL